MYDRTLIFKASEPYLRNFKLLCESRCAEVGSPQVLLFACFPLPRARGLGGKSWSVREMDKEGPLLGIWIRDLFTYHCRIRGLGSEAKFCLTPEPTFGDSNNNNNS